MTTGSPLAVDDREPALAADNHFGDGALAYEVERAVVKRLAPQGLLPGGPAHRESLRALDGRGMLLARRCLPSILGRSTYESLLEHHRFKAWAAYRRDLPRILAFGYDTGAMIHQALSRGYGRRREIAELCAVFNLGIVLFDRVCDDGEAPAIAAALDETALRAMATAELRCAERAPGGSARIAILLELIDGFFTRLRELAIQSDGATLADLAQCFVDTYRAEILSTASHVGTLSTSHAKSPPHPERAEVAKAKSQLPFELELRIAEACEPLLLRGRDGESGRADGCNIGPEPASELARYLAWTFALADDLADLEGDIRTGDLNAILVTAGFDGTAPRPPDVGREIATALLGDGHVERAVDELCEALHGTLDALTQADRPVASVRSRELVLDYLWSWLRSPQLRHAQPGATPPLPSAHTQR